jgi:hypothetical protein
LDWLALTNRLKVESGRQGSTLGTVVGATGDDARLAYWVADAWLELQRRPHGWTWMRAEIEGPTVAGQSAYTAADLDFSRVAFTAGSAEYEPGDTIAQGANNATIKRVLLTSGAWLDGDAAGEFIVTVGAGDLVAGPAAGDGVCDLAGPVVSLPAFDRWVPPTIEGYHVMATDAQGDEWELKQMAWDRYRASTTFHDSYCWRPIRYWAIGPDETLNIGPTPQDVFTLAASYYTKPVPFELDTDAPTFAEQYHMIIVWRALMELASFDAAPEVYARAQMNFANLDREMRRRYGPIANHGLSYF